MFSVSVLRFGSFWGCALIVITTRFLFLSTARRTMHALKREGTTGSDVEMKVTLKKEISAVPSLLLVLERWMLDQIDCSGLLVDVSCQCTHA